MVTWRSDTERKLLDVFHEGEGHGYERGVRRGYELGRGWRHPDPKERAILDALEQRRWGLPQWIGPAVCFVLALVVVAYAASWMFRKGWL